VKPALFLDRDGVINRDRGYVYRIAEFEFLEGIFDLCRAARGAGLEIHVVTNQAGIGRGYYTEADFSALSDWMTSCFLQQGVDITQVHYCPFHPEHGHGAYQRTSPRRKPEPGMILDAAADYKLDLQGSVMVGDKASDMHAAQAAGLGARILLSRDLTEIALAPVGGFVAGSLPEAAQLLRTILTQLQRLG
jgi:D-glycero-D-manno-heptose 1,7-bisphosphate phosphatase